MTAVAVGLVGAGPWAEMVHAPMLAAGPETRLAGVWARRAEAAGALAQRHGARAFASFDDLLDACEAVAFAVPPDVQATLATRAAAAGKALLLEKPIADSLDGARRLVRATEEAGVGSVVVFTGRFALPVRAFLDEAARFDASGGRAWFLSGAFLSGPFSTSPWRQQRGTLLDVGPHALDLVDAALGPAHVVAAHASAGGFVALTLRHDPVAVSQVSLCSTLGLTETRSGVEVFGPGGARDVDVQGALGPEAFSLLRAEFATVARERIPHPCDVHRGLVVQEMIAEAEALLAPGD